MSDASKVTTARRIADDINRGTNRVGIAAARQLAEGFALCDSQRAEHFRNRMPDVIWIVGARRGDYSDRTDYDVYWYLTKDEAESEAQRMFVASCEWRSRVESNDDLIVEARAEIGDPSWLSYDETDYTAYELRRGTTPKEP